MKCKFKEMLCFDCAASSPGIPSLGSSGDMHPTSLLIRVIERRSGEALDSGKRKALGTVRPGLESYLLAVNLDFIHIYPFRTCYLIYETDILENGSLD